MKSQRYTLFTFCRQPLSLMGLLMCLLVVSVTLRFSPISSHWLYEAPPGKEACNKGRWNQSDCVYKFPDVVIVGAKKCGTSMLLSFLGRHSQIRAILYEIHFFDRFVTKGLGWYRNRLKKTRKSHLLLEKTPRYFVTAAAPVGLHFVNPNVRIVLIVRHPIVRLISDYVHEQLFDDSIHDDFGNLVFHKNGSVDTSYAPVGVSQYDVHLKMWLRSFPLSQILIVDGEEFIKDPFSTVDQVERFIGVKPELKSTLPAFMKKNEKGYYCYQGVCPNNKGRDHIQIPHDQWQRLVQFYRPHMEQFNNMTGQNFTWVT